MEDGGGSGTGGGHQLDGSPGPNQRPRDLTKLFHGDAGEPFFPLSNREMARFYILNLKNVIEKLQVSRNALTPYLSLAANELKNNFVDNEASPHWKSGYPPFEFSCSPTQINRGDLDKPRYLDKSLIIIVAVELYAAEHAPTFNVYDHLRILRGDFFVDRFDSEAWGRLKEHYAGMDQEQRKNVFGPHAEKDFDSVFLPGIEQKFNKYLINEITNGHTMTKYTCDNVARFVEDHLPEDLHVGPVRPAGSPEPYTKSLGTKHASTKQRVPSNMDPAQLAPCN